MELQIIEKEHSLEISGGTMEYLTCNNIDVIPSLFLITFIIFFRFTVNTFVKKQKLLTRKIYFFLLLLTVLFLSLRFLLTGVSFNALAVIKI